ncbi:MAG: crossover junction endodeoxyribonuclease RuvC [Candidatus Babeliaceae bacterium]|jgi:crossover junction endodeoxyribonuclease RuvC
MIVLGIDPGLAVSGFGLVEHAHHRLKLIDAGVLKMSSSLPVHERILLFHAFFTEKITSCGVTHIALETPFLGKNAQNFLKLGYLRGIVYLLSAQFGMQLHEFAPCQVKLALTGYGGADKAQVARVVAALFPSLVVGKNLDLTDAVAIALCGAWQAKIV